YLFLSIRRRHTIFSRDWSSDVCSSDLKLVIPGTLSENASENLAIPFALLIFIGVVDVAGGIGLMVPRLSALAAVGLSVLTVLARSEERLVGSDRRSCENALIWFNSYVG